MQLLVLRCSCIARETCKHTRKPCRGFTWLSTLNVVGNPNSSGPLCYPSVGTLPSWICSHSGPSSVLRLQPSIFFALSSRYHYCNYCCHCFSCCCYHCYLLLLSNSISWALNHGHTLPSLHDVTFADKAPASIWCSSARRRTSSPRPRTGGMEHR